MVAKRVIINIFKILLNPRLFWQRYTFDKLTTDVFYSNVFSVFMLGFFLATLLGNTINMLAESGFLLTAVYSLSYCILHGLAFIVASFIEYRYCRFYLPASYSKVAVFSFTSLLPFYLLFAAISILPKMWFMIVFALYGLSVVYFGALYFLKIPRNNISIFTVITAIILCSGVLIAYALQGIIMDSITSIIE